MSVVTHFEAYLLTERRVSENTFNAYKRDIQQFMAYVATLNLTLEMVQETTISSFLASLKNAGITPRSMARKLSALKTFFSYARNHGKLSLTLESLSGPKIAKKLPNFLQEDEIEKLLAVADADTTPIGVRNKLLLYLLYVSGARISELIHLTIDDIHFDTGFLIIRGKGGKERLIPLPSWMFELLRHYIQTAHKELYQRTEQAGSHHLLFPTYYGNSIKPMTRQAAWMIVKKLWKKTGISRSISPHVLRHSLATHMLKNGVDLRSLQLILGHENLTTVQIYTHVETTHARTIYDRKHPRS